jgi:hypothetical protein
MQGTLSSIWKSTGPRRPIYKNYYIGKYNLLDPNGDYRKI